MSAKEEDPWRDVPPVKSFLHCQIFKYGTFVDSFKDCRMGRSDKVSLWYVALLINTRFRFFILE